jgi:hypothetical protein
MGATAKAAPVVASHRLRRAGVAAMGLLIRSLARHGSILCFHGVREDADPVDSVMHLTLGAFRRSMEVVRASADIVPLMELLGRWGEGQSTRGLVAITFDDAYASLLETADHWYSPHPFPIAIFVVSNASASGEPFWWDRLEALANLLTPEERVSLEAACGLPPQSRGRLDPIHGPLRGMRQRILGHHVGRAPLPFTDELSRVEAHYRSRTTQRPMRLEESQRMAQLGPVTFGVHTVNHAVLPLLPRAEAEHEIREGWAALQRCRLPSIIPVLAVPFGLLDDSLPSLSADAGMSACLALDDRTLPRLDGSLARPPASRIAMVERTTSLRLGYRLSGVRDTLRREAPPELAALREERDAQ